MIKNLDLEVKASNNVNELKNEIAEAVSENLPSAKVVKRLRPETMYFGNLRKTGELSLSSSRIFRPTYGIVGVLWDNNNNKSCNQPNVKDCLDKVKCKVKGKELWYWPDVIYVPKGFLAFKVITKVKSGRSTWRNIPIGKNEYPFLNEENKWPNKKPLSVNYGGKQYRMEYRYLEYKNNTKKNELNLLYVFTFWLCQEILKFALEIPDYHRYLLRKGDPRLDGRQAAHIAKKGKKKGKWEMVKFNVREDEWDDV